MVPLPKITGYLTNKWCESLPEEDNFSRYHRLLETIKTQPPKQIAKRFYEATVALCREGELALSQDLFSELEDILPKDAPFVFRAHGARHWFLGQFDEGIQSIQKALEGFSAQGKILQALSTKINLGTLLSRPYPVEGLRIYEEALQQACSLGMLYEEATLRNNIATLHLRKGQFIEGIMYSRAAQIIRKHLGDFHGLASSCNNESIAFIGLGDLQAATIANQKALQSLAKQKATPRSFHYLVICARLQLLQGFYAEGRKSIEEALSLQHFAQKELGYLFQIEQARLSLLDGTNEEGLKSIAQSQKAMESEELHSYPLVRAELGEVLGQLYLKNHQFYLAKSVFLSVIEQEEDCNASNSLVRLSLSQIPDIPLPQKIQWLEEVRKFAMETGNQHFHIRAYTTQMELFKGEGQFLKALELSQAVRTLEQQKYNRLVKVHAKVLEVSQKQEKYQEELQKAEKRIHHLQYTHRETAAQIHQQQESIKLLAHNIRGPLAIIGLSLQLLRQGALDTEEACDDALEAQKRILDMLDRQLQSMNESTSPEHLKEVSIIPLLSQVYRDFRRIAEQKDIELYLEAPDELTLLTEREVLREALENLVSNALKFSPPGRTVQILSKHTEHTLQIRVDDQGPGISSQEQQKLFQPYSKLSPEPTAGESSTGLGLYLTQNQLKRLGGKLTCESEEGQGASFIIELPIITPQENGTNHDKAA